MKNLHLYLLIYVIIFISGCGQTQQIAGPLASIEIIPSSAILLTGTTTQFIAIGRDSSGNEVPLYGNFSIKTISITGEGEIAEIENTGTVSGTNRRFANISTKAPGTGEVYFVSGSVQGISSITVLIGTIESITVNCTSPIPLENGSSVTFIATGEDEGGNPIYITPTWEVLGNIGTIESVSGNTMNFKPLKLGLGTIEAYFQGKMGSKEVWVQGSQTSDASSYVDEGNPSTNYSSSDYLKAAYYPGTSSTKESYIYFDLSQIPQNKTITSAFLTLTIYAKSLEGSEVTITCHKVNASWNESTITWNNKPSFNSTALDSVSVDSSTNSISFEVKSTVQDWINNPSNNYGFAIVKKTEGNKGEVTFERTILNEAKRPKLTITF